MVESRWLGTSRKVSNRRRRLRVRGGGEAGWAQDECRGRDSLVAIQRTRRQSEVDAVGVQRRLESQAVF